MSAGENSWFIDWGGVDGEIDLRLTHANFKWVGVLVAPQLAVAQTNMMLQPRKSNNALSYSSLKLLSLSLPLCLDLLAAIQACPAPRKLQLEPSPPKL